MQRSADLVGRPDVPLGVEPAAVRADLQLPERLLQGRDRRRRRELRPHPAVGQRAVVRDRERRVAGARRLPHDQRPAVGGDDRAVREQHLLGHDRRRPVRIDPDQVRGHRVRARHEVEAELARVGDARGRHDHVVQMPAAVLADVGVQRHVPLGRPPQHPVVLHRHHEQRAVRQPAHARRLALDLHHLLFAPVGGDRDHPVAVEVRQPPAPVVPARPLEERSTLQQRRQLRRRTHPPPVRSAAADHRGRARARRRGPGRAARRPGARAPPAPRRSTTRACRGARR